MGILSRLGGVSASSPQQATHLVMPQLRRTDNLLLCLPRSVSNSTGLFQANNLNSRNQEWRVDSSCTFSVSNLCWPPPGWRKVDLQTGWSSFFVTACLAVIIWYFMSLVFFGSIPGFIYQWGKREKLQMQTMYNFFYFQIKACRHHSKRRPPSKEIKLARDQRNK